MPIDLLAQKNKVGHVDLLAANTSTNVSATEQPKQGILGKVGGFVNSIFKGVTAPIVQQAVVRPFQLAKSMESTMRNPLAEPNLDVNLPYYGKFTAPSTVSDVQKEFGTSLKTVGVGLGPVSGGAMFGAGGAIESGAKPLALGTQTVLPTSLGDFVSSTPMQAVIGALTGKVLSKGIEVAGKGIGAVGGALKTLGKGSSAISESAAKSFAQVLSPTTKANKAITAKAAPELAKRGIFAWSRKGLARLAGTNAKTAGEAVDMAYDALPKGTTANISPIVNGIQKLKSELRIDAPGTPEGGFVPQVSVTKFNALDAIEKEIKSLAINSEAEIVNLRAYKQPLGKSIGKKFFTDTDQAVASARKESYGVIRDELAKQFPAIDVLNKEFSFWNNVRNITNAAIERKQGQVGGLGQKILTGAGVAGGFAKSGAGGAVEAGLIMKGLSKVLESTAWKTATGSMKQKIADAITMGDDSAIAKIIQPILTKTGSIFKTVGGVVSGVPKAIKELPRKDIPGTPQLNLKQRLQSIRPGLSIEDVSKKAPGQVAPKLKTNLQDAQTALREAKGLSNSSQKNLMALHNLTEDNYTKAKNIGGLANPSLAIIDPKKGGLEGFGEITLVGDKSLVTSPKAKTYGADVYSPRFPSTETRIKDFTVLEKRLSKYEDITGEKVRNIDTSDINKDLKRNSLAMADFLTKSKIELPKGKTRYDLRSSMETIIDKKNLGSKFAAYLDDIIAEAGGEERIIKGWTQAGNKMTTPLTAEAASRQMNKEATRAGEGFHYGLGSVRSQVAPEFKTISRIRANQNKIVSDAEFEKLKTAYEENYSKLLNEIEPYDTIKDENQFIAYDRMSQAVADYIGGIDRKFFAEKFPRLPSDTIAKIEEFKNTLREMPTEYFETKFRRVVQPGEFKYAVVPNTVSKETVAKMEKDGLSIVKYNPKIEGDRLAKLKNLQEITAFALLMGIGLSASGKSIFKTNQ